MNRILTLSLLFTCCAHNAIAEDITENNSFQDIQDSNSILETDTLSTNIKLMKHSSTWEDYNPEHGFFQKAYSDKSDPTFMITNENNSFQFGIGGTIHMTASQDFYGSVYNPKFVTWNIPVPTDHANHFSLNMASTNFYCKTKATMGGKQLIGYISFSANDNEDIGLDQAYISYGGLSVGKTYSFFMDLAAGVENVDLRGPNTQVSRTHALVGYTLPIKDKWIIAAAIERTELDLYPSESKGLYNEHQSVPDITAKIVYKSKFGHLQLSGIYRTLRYWSLDKALPADVTFENGSTKFCPGIGLSLSGKVKLTPQTFISFQGICGKGIQQYIQDYKDAQMDLVPDRRIVPSSDNAFYKMKTLPVLGGYIGLQNNYSSKFTFDGVFGIVRMKTPKIKNASTFEDETMTYLDYKRTAYFALNAFYHMNDYCTVGAGFLSGYKWVRERDRQRILTGKTNCGIANRLSLMFTYSF